MFAVWGIMKNEVSNLVKKNELTKAERTTSAGGCRADWIDREAMGHVLAALMPENRLAIEVAIATGLRISDVLSIETDKLRDKNGELGNRNRITVRELKTGKNRRVYLPNELLEKMIRIAGKYYVFEGRINPKKHRTRQAVAKDMKRARQILRAKKLVVSPHTARKMWAVEQTKNGKDIRKLQKLMNHSDPSITMVYAMADEITRRKIRA